VHGDDRGIAAVEVAAAKRRRGGVGIVVIAFHHCVAADHDLADRRAVAGHVAAVFVDDAELA